MESRARSQFSAIYIVNRIIIRLSWRFIRLIGMPGGEGGREGKMPGARSFAVTPGAPVNAEPGASFRLRPRIFQRYYIPALEIIEQRAGRSERDRERERER